MSLYSWLQNLRSALAPVRGKRRHTRQSSHRAARHRPSLEVLEDRLTPSFMWAETLSDAPPGVEWAPPPPLLADFTSDGILDRLGHGFGREVTVEPGLGDGTFGDPIFSEFYADYLAVADFNGDGRLDVVGTTPGSGYSIDDTGHGGVKLGRGDGTFYGYESFELSVWPTATGTVDVNGDGRTDVVVAGYGYDPYFDVFINDGNWPPRPLSLRIGDATVMEGNTGATAANFTVTLSEASTDTVTVDYATGTSGLAGSEFQATSGTLTFAPGETSQTITVLVNGDRLGEPNETFVVNLSNPTNATIHDGYGDGTIVDDEPRISISDVTRSEGQKGQTTLFSFTVTLSAAYDQPVTMSFRTVNGTAKSSEDYIAKTGTLTFAPGETTKTITIEVKGDTKKEADETFYLDLFGLSSNALFTKNRGIGTILNDD
jgi:Calx-beta domain-containing protein/FG-GAP repeat protein